MSWQRCVYAHKTGKIWGSAGFEVRKEDWKDRILAGRHLMMELHKTFAISSDFEITLCFRTIGTLEYIIWCKNNGKHVLGLLECCTVICTLKRTTRCSLSYLTNAAHFQRQGSWWARCGWIWIGTTCWGYSPRMSIWKYFHTVCL